MMSEDRAVRVSPTHTHTHTHTSHFTHSTHPPQQLNYDYLRKCVAAGPVTPMPGEVWDKILDKLAASLVNSPLSAPLLPQLHKYTYYLHTVHTLTLYTSSHCTHPHTVHTLTLYILSHCAYPHIVHTLTLYTPTLTLYTPSHYREVKSGYEATLRKAIIQTTLNKPTLGGMQPDPPLFKEKE